MKLLAWVEEVATALDAGGAHTGQGTTNTWDEAAWLVLWALGWPLDTPLEVSTDESPDEPPSKANMELNPEQVEAIREALHARVANKKPMAYIAQEAWLQGLSFYVDERTIIPRSLIAEVLMSDTLLPWMNKPPERILDLCTGNGSLAVLSAIHWPNAFVLGSDVSPDALQVAQINAARHGLEARMEWRVSNGIEAFTLGSASSTPPLSHPHPHPHSHLRHHSQEARFDLIVCNPPYVPHESMQSLPAEFKAEPALALAGGEDGMDFIQTVLPKLHPLMTEAGLLVLEIGHEIEAFTRHYPRLPFVGLSTQESEEQVLLLTAQELKAHFLEPQTESGPPLH
jgi:ribosomal protein L3 glutamine methyltransferase